MPASAAPTAEEAAALRRMLTHLLGAVAAGSADAEAFDELKDDELLPCLFHLQQSCRVSGIARLLAKQDAVLSFTCMDMKDEQQPGHASCSPELLV